MPLHLPVGQAAHDVGPGPADEIDHVGGELVVVVGQQPGRVAAGLTDVVEAQFRAIRDIYEQQAEFGDDDTLLGFRRLHVREHPAAPLPGLVSKRRLLSLLPPGPDTDSAGAFSRTIGPSIVYGLSDGDAVTVLGVQFEGAPEPTLAGPLHAVMDTFHLMLVDWCRCALIGPDDLDGYLAEESDV